MSSVLKLTAGIPAENNSSREAGTGRSPDGLIKRGVSEQSPASHATTQSSPYKTSEEGNGNVPRAADQFKLARAPKSRHRRRLEGTVTRHAQSSAFIYASTLLPLSTSIQELSCNKILQNVQFWCTGLKAV